MSIARYTTPGIALEFRGYDKFTNYITISLFKLAHLSMKQKSLYLSNLWPIGKWALWSYLKGRVFYRKVEGIIFIIIVWPDFKVSFF